MRSTEESLKEKKGCHYLSLSRDRQYRGGKAEGTITQLDSPGLSLVLAWGMIHFKKFSVADPHLQILCGGASTQKMIITNVL